MVFSSAQLQNGKNSLCSQARNHTASGAEKTKPFQIKNHAFENRVQERKLLQASIKALSSMCMQNARTDLSTVPGKLSKKPSRACSSNHIQYVLTCVRLARILRTFNVHVYHIPCSNQNQAVCMLKRFLPAARWFDSSYSGRNEQLVVHTQVYSSLDLLRLTVA